MSKHSSPIWLVVAIPICAILLAVFLMRTRPRAERRTPPVQIPVVETIALKRESVRASLPVMGTVRPAAAVTLKARVTGDIVATHPNWYPGGRITQGERLLEIDPTDYRIALAQAQADMAQAESDLLLETGRQDVAAREWELLGPDDGGSELDRTLALRAPQRAAAEARVAAAAARVERATIDLDRTNVRAPFNAILLSREVNVGDQVTPQLALARLAGTDHCHVVAPVPVGRLPQIPLPSPDSKGAEAQARWPDGTTRNGQVIALLGDLEARGSMAQLLIDIPLGQAPQPFFGSYIEVTLTGTALPPAFKVPRRALLDDTTALLLTPENTLRIVSTTALWQERDSVICTFDHKEGEQLIVSGLPTAVEGMALRTKGTGPKPAPGKPKQKPEPGARK